MRLRDLGEFELIDRIRRLAAPVHGRQVVLGIGDDAALLRPRRGEDLVVTSDALVEGTHFKWEAETPRMLGRRALAANLSDLAAMGSRPMGFIFALAAPPSLEVRRVTGMVRGMLDLAKPFACPLVGGNVTRARETSITITALGGVAPGRILRRSGALVGDRILVTGELGISALERARSRVRRIPEPRVAEGRALARLASVTACIDVSDGLLADLAHLLEASSVGGEIDARRVPTPRGFAAACRRLGRDPLQLALGGGEDYELLFTMSGKTPSSAALKRRLGTPVTEIGEVTQRGLRVRGASTNSPGWRHF
jgi:thiamine-monophosphate kinase